MNDERLQTALRTLPDRLEVPPTLVPDALDRGWRQARRRPFLIAAAAAAATAASIGLAYVATSDSSDRSAPPVKEPANVVPWVDRPAARPASLSASPPQALYKACTADDLSARLDRQGAAMGTYGLFFRLQNVSARPCTLDGTPTALIGIRSDGSTQPLHYKPTGGLLPTESSWPANLAPGDRANFGLSMPSTCPSVPVTASSDAFSRIAIGIPGGGTVSAAVDFTDACGISASRLGAPADTHLPSLYHGLRATLDRPDTAVAGSTVHFTVTLHNESLHPIALDPCPTYTEGTYFRHSMHFTYRLNCDSITSIEPGQWVTYAMQLALPEERGQGKFFWGIDNSNAISGGVITLTAPPTAPS